MIKRVIREIAADGSSEKGGRAGVIGFVQELELGLGLEGPRAGAGGDPPMTDAQCSRSPCAPLVLGLPSPLSLGHSHKPHAAGTTLAHLPAAGAVRGVSI